MNIVINENVVNCYATETRPGKVDLTLGAADCDWFHDLFFPYGDSQEGIEVISGIFCFKDVHGNGWRGVLIGIDGHHTGKKYQIHTSGVGETKDKAVKNTRQLWLRIRNEIEHKRSEGVF